MPVLSTQNEGEHHRIKDFASSPINVDRLPSLQHQIVSSDPLPDIVDFVYDGLEVGSSIVRTGNENVVDFARGCWGVQWID